MSKLFGSIVFFLVAVILVYFLNLPAAEFYAQNYFDLDPFEATHVIAAFELLHHPFSHFWVIPSWLIAGFLGGVISRSWKGALVVSIITGFILSLTWIFLMSRYLPNYWSDFISTHSSLQFFGQTMGLGLLLGGLAAIPGMLGGYIRSPRKSITQSPLKEIETTCPNCGTIFQSKPQYCYKCNTILQPSSENEPEGGIKK
ncbi:MAG TPA: zinc ribbon domain-containing protein [Candidatus Deferrimicrobium sp.]|nr:zinc ribbon domain-containing protein [Candidatus Deferrimicrobium sp.]